MTTITITFERMPGLDELAFHPFRFRFEEYPVKVVFKGQVQESRVVLCTVTGQGNYVGTGLAYKAVTHKQDLDAAMRASCRRALYVKSPYVERKIYRAFRRWMWLAKAAHECDKHTDCIECPFMDDDIHCDGDWMDGKSPAAKIASEFGRVTVRVT